MSAGIKKKITVLKDNPPLSGKKFFIVSMISPESRQKHDVHALKIHDMCEREDEAKILCEYYHGLDPDFDVFHGTVGKWSPWVWDPLSITNVEYADSRMTELIKGHRMHMQSNDRKWHEEVEKHIEEIKKGNTKEGQLAMANKKEHPRSLWFKIKQLDLVIKRRREEKEALESIFHRNYTKEERKDAQNCDLPLTEPAPMQYTLLGSDGNRDEIDVGTTENENEESLPEELEQELAKDRDW